MTPGCHSGPTAPSYADDFYHRLHFLPTNQIELGVVLADLDSIVQVWSAFLTNVTLDGITSVGDDGLTLVGPGPASPYEALELTQYTLQVAFDGPITISAAYTFEAGSKFSALTISGTRSVAAPFLPNWKTAVTERFKFSSITTRSYDGTAQTSQISEAPRRAMSFTTLSLSGASRAFDNLLWKAHPFSPVVPICTDPTELVGQHLSGDTVLTVLDASTRNFNAGGFAMLVSGETYEVVTIASVSGNMLTLSIGLQSNWHPYAEIYPAAPVKLSGSTRSSRYTSQHQSARISYDLLPGDSDPNLPVAAAPNTFKGYEAYLKEPDWKDDISHSMVSNSAVMDAGFGKKGYKVSRTNADPILTFTWGLLSRQAIEDFRAFMQRCGGSSNPVFMPAWAHDLTIITPLANTGSTFDVADDSYYSTLVGAASGRNTLLIRTSTLGDFMVKVDAVVDNLDGTLTLTVDTPFAEDVSVAEIKLCSFMPLCLMGNSVEFKWISPTVAMATASFTGIPY
jgi:hypothetical protein